MKESSAMTEILKIKEELSEKAKKMTSKEFIKFINQEAQKIKNMAKTN
jgi:hypothetical protein